MALSFRIGSSIKHVILSKRDYGYEVAKRNFETISSVIFFYQKNVISNGQCLGEGISYAYVHGNIKQRNSSPRSSVQANLPPLPNSNLPPLTNNSNGDLRRNSILSSSFSPGTSPKLAQTSTSPRVSRMTYTSNDGSLSRSQSSVSGSRELPPVQPLMSAVPNVFNSAAAEAASDEVEYSFPNNPQGVSHSRTSSLGSQHNVGNFNTPGFSSANNHDDFLAAISKPSTVPIPNNTFHQPMPSNAPQHQPNPLPPPPAGNMSMQDFGSLLSNPVGVSNSPPSQPPQQQTPQARRMYSKKTVISRKKTDGTPASPIVPNNRDSYIQNQMHPHMNVDARKSTVLPHIPMSLPPTGPPPPVAATTTAPAALAEPTAEDEYSCPDSFNSKLAASPHRIKSNSGSCNTSDVDSHTDDEYSDPMAMPGQMSPAMNRKDSQKRGRGSTVSFSKSKSPTPPQSPTRTRHSVGHTQSFQVMPSLLSQSNENMYNSELLPPPPSSLPMPNSLPVMSTVTPAETTASPEAEDEYGVPQFSGVSSPLLSSSPPRIAQQAPLNKKGLFVDNSFNTSRKRNSQDNIFIEDQNYNWKDDDSFSDVSDNEPLNQLNADLFDDEGNRRPVEEVLNAMNVREGAYDEDLLLDTDGGEYFEIDSFSNQTSNAPSNFIGLLDPDGELTSDSEMKLPMDLSRVQGRKSRPSSLAGFGDTNSLNSFNSGSKKSRSSSIAGHSASASLAKVDSSGSRNGAMFKRDEQRANFKKMMRTPDMRNEFTDFLVGEYCVENILFADSLDEYMQFSTYNSGPELYDAAIELHSEYLKASSPHEVNIPYIVLCEINKTLFGESYVTVQASEFDFGLPGNANEGSDNNSSSPVAGTTKLKKWKKKLMRSSTNDKKPAKTASPSSEKYQVTDRQLETVFDHAYNHILDLLVTDCYPRFLKQRG
eukprot:Awhi_evm1s6912